MLGTMLLALAVVQGTGSHRVRIRPGHPDPPPAQLDSATLATAYLDAGAAELVRLARERRESVDQSVVAYRALAKEQISAGIRVLGHDKMLYRREVAANIDWQRDGARRVDIIGAREAIPVAITGVQVPEDLRGDARDLAFTPGDPRLQIGLDDSSFVRHPLAVGSEVDYQFQSGDTTVVEFPGGRTIRLFELRIIPRRDEFRLIRGSFWLDEATHSVVRAVFRPARAFDLERDGHTVDPNDPDSGGDHVPGFLQPVTGDVRVVTIEYALWEGKWWMPRLMLFDGVASAGSLLHMPLRYERVYSRYEVLTEADTATWTEPNVPTPEEAAAAADSLALARARRRGEVRAGVNVRIDNPRRRRPTRYCTSADYVALDTATVDSLAAFTDGPRRPHCNRTYVAIPGDTAALLHSPELPGSIFAQDEGLVSQSDLADLTAQLQQIPAVPWKLHAPSWAIGLGGSGLVRYNRVEALSVAGRSTFDLGKVKLDGTARIGLGDQTPYAEVGVVHDALNTHTRLAAYRRLDLADPETHGLGMGNSLSALLLGRDDGDYYRSFGLELSQSPSPTLPQSVTWRVFAEQQRAAAKTTDVSLPRLFSSTRAFRPNIVADSADEAGAGVALHGNRGLNPKGLRWGADFAMDLSMGTFVFGRVSLANRLAFPLPAHLTGALGVAAGTSAGDVPVQGRYYLGGPATLRGYDGAAASGESFWRGRLEVANDLPAARLVAFSDVGWAGPRSQVTLRDPLWSLGAGVSLLDGLVRFDLARALRGPTGWRMEMYVGGAL